MEYYCQHSNSGIGGSYGTKEKRPPLKRGQLKRHIVRTISNLVVPRNQWRRTKKICGRANYNV
jgi:hypothetical protein